MPQHKITVSVEDRRCGCRSQLLSPLPLAMNSDVLLVCDFAIFAACRRAYYQARLPYLSLQQNRRGNAEKSKDNL